MRDRGRLPDRHRRDGVQRRWFAGGQPAELVPPGDWDRIRAIMGPLDYPGTVFGVAATGTGTPMSDVARRYARGLALHHRDLIVPDQRHTPTAM